MTLEQTKSEEKNPKIQLHVLKGYGETKKTTTKEFRRESYTQKTNK